MQQQRKARSVKQMAEKQLATLQDYKRVFNSEQGKRVLYDLMNNFDMMRPTYDPKNPNEIFVREGGRNVVLYILGKLKAETKTLEQYLEEANEHANT